VLTGVEPEARLLGRALGIAGHGNRDGLSVQVAAVGIGAHALPTVLDGRDLLDTVLVSAGVCGALDPALPVGALVVPEAVQLASGALLPVTAALHKRALAASGSPARGVLLAVDRLVATPEAKRELRELTGAIAVDMESGPVLAAAAARHRPSLVLRAVADTAGEAVSPELAALVDGNGQVRLGRAAGAVLRRPDLVPQGLRLARATRRALRSVAAVLLALQRSLVDPRPVAVP
jgi:adenosylhomocysteine nucleosidase